MTEKENACIFFAVVLIVHASKPSPGLLHLNTTSMIIFVFIVISVISCSTGIIIPWYLSWALLLRLRCLHHAKHRVTKV